MDPPWVLARLSFYGTAEELPQRSLGNDNVIHHSDQGCQYTSIAFGKHCEKAEVRPQWDRLATAMILCVQ
jgi:transposase InsO family protein